MIEIKHENLEKRGRFAAYNDGAEVGEMTYTYAGPKKAIFDHTFVDDSMRGQNVGKLMLDKAAEWLRSEEIKLIPLCPYVKAQVVKHPDLYGDLL